MMGSRFREFEITQAAIDDAIALGLEGDVVDRIRGMARQAAPFTHPICNRRFEQYGMVIHDGRVVTVMLLGRPNQRPAEDPRFETNKEARQSYARDYARRFGRS